MLSVTADPRPAWADGLLQGLSGAEEITYSVLGSKTTDASGTTSRIDTANYVSRSHYRLNYNLLPKLNLNAGGTTETNLSELSGDAGDAETTITRFRPYVWLTLRDPVLGAAVGYDLSEDTSKTSGQSGVTLGRETYNASFTWRPPDLPATQARFARASTRDGARKSLDTDQDQFSLKSEYAAAGVNAYYAGASLSTRDNLRARESSQVSHDGKLLYAATFLDGRISATTDNRLRFTELVTDRGAPPTGLEGAAALGLLPAAGLAALDDTPLDDALAASPALIDGDTATSAGVNLGFPGPGGDARRRNVGLDFGSAVAVTTLRVWVDRDLPADLASAFSWDVYTSANNVTWSFHTTVPVALFGPFDRRFEIVFPAVTARYVKAVTRPLSGGVVGSTNSALFPSVFITEVQALVDRTAQGAGKGKTRITQTIRTHTLDVKAILSRTPSLSYRFNGDYQEFDTEAEPRYTMSHGLFFTHRFHPIVSASANASLELGRERAETRTGIVYHASLAATPRKSLTDSLVFSGTRHWTGATTSTNNSVVLYNTAQLYRGIDVTLNLGAVLTAEEGGGAPSRREEAYVNLGTGLTPHPALTVTTYYLGKRAESSGGGAGGRRETTENRLDVGLSFTPFRSLVLSAATNMVSETGQETRVTQNYGLGWSPFPDGLVQVSLSYAENHLADTSTSRTVQPTLRWYLTARRRSYLEVTYQRTTTEANSLSAESHLFSTGLNVPF